VKAAILYARFALGAAFLSAVASRFGLWTHQPAAARFKEFIAYTGEVCAFVPRPMIPLFAWSATAAETAFGLALIAGFKLRETAFGAAILLAMFGFAMAISQGVKSPLDYSVFSASAAAVLLGRASTTNNRTA
jgi:uncharacterized membrane protein YphA (DoxX/SURF4 family)